MRATVKQAVANVELTLRHHEEVGAVKSWSRDGQRWRVSVTGHGEHDLSLQQAYALCVGLAAAEASFNDRYPIRLSTDVGAVRGAHAGDHTWVRVTIEREPEGSAPFVVKLPNGRRTTVSYEQMLVQL